MTSFTSQTPPPDALSARGVACTLLNWFDLHGRVFTWRQHTNAYFVLVAEILLRKTSARAVERFLPEFLTTFPTIEALSNASVEELTDKLSILGLGSQRALQLHELASRIVHGYDGQVPTNVVDLRSLPGVGRYTASMVASTSMHLPIPAVDTNVARVICRVFGIIPSHFEARKSTNVWALADNLVQSHPDAGVHVTWALLDLAALVCTPRAPKCPDCPLQKTCAHVQRASTRE